MLILFPKIVGTLRYFYYFWCVNNKFNNIK
nr:MAG TPA: hypothetical protein [Caudoviricetes sp.]